MRSVSLDYYDKILGAIAASLGLGIVVGVGTQIRLYYAVVVGSLVASVLIYAGMFRNPPLPDEDRKTTVAVLVWHVYLLALLLAGLP